MCVFFGLVWFYGISTIVSYSMPNPFLYILIFLFRTIQFSISTVFVFSQLNVRTVLFQIIQFSMSTWFSSIWPILRILSGSTNPSQSGPGSSDNEGKIQIPKDPSNCLLSFARHSLGESYPSAEMQLLHSIAPADWAICGFLLLLLFFCFVFFSREIFSFPS